MFYTACSRRFGLNRSAAYLCTGQSCRNLRIGRIRIDTCFIILRKAANNLVNNVSLIYLKMKKTRLLAAALAAVLMLGSCAKEQDNAPEVAGQRAKLTVRISNPASKSVSPIPTADRTVTKFLAFVFRADGDLDVLVKSSDGTTVSTNQATTAATEIYLIANADFAQFENITTKAALLAEVATSDAQQSVRWATGSEAITFTQSGNDFSADVDIALKFVSSRIVVNVVNEMENYDQGEPGELVLTDVAILNAFQTSKLFGSSLVSATKSYYSGISMAGMTNMPTVYDVKSYLTDSYSEGDVYHYYVLENDAATFEEHPTIVTLVAEFKEQTIYFPVHLAPYEEPATAGVVRGKSYSITITLSGDASPDGGGGVIDPTIPVISATVNVSVTIDDWDTVAIGKEFGN